MISKAAVVAAGLGWLSIIHAFGITPASVIQNNLKHLRRAASCPTWLEGALDDGDGENVETMTKPKREVLL